MNIGDVNVIDFLTAILMAGSFRAVPLTLASLGEAVGERAGLLNLGVEGMMLCGCFFGFWAAYHTSSLLIGMATAMAAGVVMALIFGLLTITMRVDQVLTGLAITIFGAGLSAFLFRDLFGGTNVAVDVDPVNISIPLLRDIPIIGGPLFERQLLFYICWALVPIFAYLLKRTKFGLEVRAVGENPFAADAAGVRVARTRYQAIVIAGAMAGFAGGFLSVADVGIFSIGMTVGQGFIALAITMLGRWNPYRIVIGALLFGALQTLADQLQINGIDVNTEFIGTFPYIGIMLALVVLAGRTPLPAALGIPYARGER
jgi:general nucleoside transport system permease protein